MREAAERVLAPQFRDCWRLTDAPFLQAIYDVQSPRLAFGRVTMLGESDGNRLRRIYTDGRGHPENGELSFFGHSIGKWEGDTLVVETINVKPQTMFAVSEAAGVPNNGGLKMWERIRLTEIGRAHV